MSNGQPSKARQAFLAADEGLVHGLAMDPADTVILECRAGQFEGLARAAWRTRDSQGARYWMHQCMDVMSVMIRRDPSAKTYIADYSDKLKLARRLGVSTAGF